jgi:hypothetical protein
MGTAEEKMIEGRYKNERRRRADAGDQTEGE